MSAPSDHESYYRSLLSENSLPVDSEGVAESEPAPDVVSDIPDPRVRHHYEVSWRNASRLSNLLFQRAIWHITLKYTGYADPKIPYTLEKPIRACIAALCHHGWFGGNPNELLKLLPPLPSGPSLTIIGSSLFPDEPPWYEDGRLRERMAAFFDGSPLRDLRRRLGDILLLVKAEAPRSSDRGEIPASASSVVADQPEQREENWISATEAMKIAKVLGCPVSLTTISKEAKKGIFESRPSERYDGTKLEVEVGSFTKWARSLKSKNPR